ncbi:MAG: 30S ribosomal protein S16 [bacterium]
MVKIRLRRMGAKKRPFYRMVVSPSTAPRNGRFVETIGTYDPLTDPSTVKINAERAAYWISTGAQPTDTARWLLEREGILQKKVTKKTQA